MHKKHIDDIIANSEKKGKPPKGELLALLAADDEEALFTAADRVRERCVGNDVHLRGIIEFSNRCVKNCLYCGLRRGNKHLERYHMTGDEIIQVAGAAAEMGLKTLVLQSGEDPYYSADLLAGIVYRLKEAHDIAVTLSVGERTKNDYKLLKEAGADRYLLKHETADPVLFARLRPGTRLSERIKRLYWLKELGYQVGSGNMVGLPGQTMETIADDILLMREIDVEMAGIGPFIPHPHTPLAGCMGGTADLTLRTLAVARLTLPYAHLPATTALASIHEHGRELALRRGANVVMPDVTPLHYKKLYEIYPGKVCVTEDSRECVPCISGMILSAGRKVATDQGHSAKPKAGAAQTIERKSSNG